MPRQCEFISENVSGGTTQEQALRSPEEFVKGKNFKSFIIGPWVCVQRWGTAGDTFFMEMNSLARAMMAVNEWKAAPMSRCLIAVLLSAVLQGFAHISGASSHCAG